MASHPVIRNQDQPDRGVAEEEIEETHKKLQNAVVSSEAFPQWITAKSGGLVALVELLFHQSYLPYITQNISSSSAQNCVLQELQGWAGATVCMLEKRLGPANGERQDNRKQMLKWLGKVEKWGDEVVSG